MKRPEHEEPRGRTDPTRSTYPPGSRLSIDSVDELVHLGVIQSLDGHPQNWWQYYARGLPEDRIHGTSKPRR